jgi:hypothetical protein
MLLFNRTIQTSGDLPAIMPLLQEITAITKANDVPMNVWVGGNGFTAGTAIFSVGYESIAARAAAQSRLMAAKGWWEVNRKMREHVLSSDPDIIMNYVRGGSLGTAIPVGTIVQTNQFQLAQGADFMAALKWANEFADLHTKVTGVEGNILHTIYGVLGGMGMIMGFPNAEEIDAARAKASASAEWMTKYLEGGKFAMAGTLIARLMTKVA